MTEHTHPSNNNSASTLLAGLVIGVALTYLFGTEDGRKLKDQLIKEGQKLLSTLEDKKEEVREKVEPEIEQKIVETVQAMEGVKDDVVDNISEVPQHIEALQKKGRKFFFHRGSRSAES